jgi:hypothetical protein
LNTFLITPMCDKRSPPYHHPSINHRNNIWWSSSLWCLLQPLSTSSLVSKYSPQHPVLRHHNLCSSLSLKDQVSPTIEVTKSTEQSTFWEADSHYGSQ